MNCWPSLRSNYIKRVNVSVSHVSPVGFFEIHKAPGDHQSKLATFGYNESIGYRFIRIKASAFCRGGFDISSNHPIPDTPRIDCVKIGSHLCVLSHWCGGWMDYLISYLAAKRMKIRVEATTPKPQLAVKKGGMLWVPVSRGVGFLSHLYTSFGPSNHTYNHLLRRCLCVQKLGHVAPYPRPASWPVKFEYPAPNVELSVKDLEIPWTMVVKLNTSHDSYTVITVVSHLAYIYIYIYYTVIYFANIPRRMTWLTVGYHAKAPASAAFRKWRAHSW